MSLRGIEHTARTTVTAAAAICVIAAVGTIGCTNYATPLQTEPPRPNRPTEVTKDLKQLPPPQDQVVAAVYRFRDQTGQHKPSPGGGTSFSTAVTQGATSILIGALEDSGWFVPIERAGLSNLMNERQIIQQIRQQYTTPQGEKLGKLDPLLYAGVLLEGGIIGYNTNTLTGATAARYFGAGASGQFRQDQVTVYLRAVSTQTGRILKTVHATKTVLSQEMEAGVFRFVEPDRLLQAQVSYTSNEPTTVAVREAIEESVKALVVEGVEENLWSLQDSSDIDHPAFQEYRREKQLAALTDRFDRLIGYRRGGLALGLRVGGQRYQGNFEHPLVRPGGSVSVSGAFSRRFRLGGELAAGGVAAKDGFEQTAASVEAEGTYHLLPRGAVSPYLTGGVGLLANDLEDFGTELGEDLFPIATWGVGVERLMSPGLALDIGLENQYALEDGIDGIAQGDTTTIWNDSVWRLTAGLKLYTSQF